MLDLVLMERKRAGITNILPDKGAECDTGHYRAVVKIKERHWSKGN